MANAARPSTESDPDRKPIVLIVEDEVYARTAASEYLRDAGFSVIEAVNADEAMTLLKAGTTIDVVFSDVRMPGTMDGFQLERWVAAHHPHMHVLLASAVLEIRAGALSDYGRRFMAKPYIFADMERRLRDLIMLDR